jgi:hypothetical protein
MDSIRDLLQNVAVRTLLLMVGAAVLKKWPAFVNKAIPIALLVANSFYEGLTAMFPALVPAAHAAADALATAGSGHHGLAFGKFFFNAVVPVVLAVGAHSASKNTREWANVGWKVLQQAGRTG